MKGKGIASAVAVDRASVKMGSKIGEKISLGSGEENSAQDSGKGRLDEVGFGASGVLKPWSFQATGLGLGRDKNQAPPPLPVPIASFTI